MNERESLPSEIALPSGKVAGAALVLASLIATVAVAHHPSVSRAHDAADVLAKILAVRAADQAVHAAAIAAVIGLLFGFVVFVLRRGLRDSTALAALVSYSIGTVAVVGAGSIDGFIIPALAARYAAASHGEIAVALQLITVCAIAVQTLTKIWLVATSVAVIVWSARIVRGTRTLRAVALLGFVSSMLVIAGTVLVANFNPHSLGLIVLVQTLWSIAIGVLMIREEL